MESFAVDSKSRKIIRLAKDDELDKALYLWYGLYSIQYSVFFFVDM